MEIEGLRLHQFLSRIHGSAPGSLVESIRAELPEVLNPALLAGLIGLRELPAPRGSNGLGPSIAYLTADGEACLRDLASKARGLA